MNLLSLSRMLTAALLLATLAPAAGLAQGNPQAGTQAKLQVATRGAVGELGPYRQAIADAIAETFESGRSLSAFQAGLLRVSRAPQPGDYAVCLQTIENGRIAYFAAFITAGEVDTIRRAVGIDRCWLETNYSTLPPPRPPKKKNPWEKPTAR
jgi:hypothetical protein